jgi:IMP cyclohydrolase
MSMQRAIINCQRCHYLASKVVNEAAKLHNGAGEEHINEYTMRNDSIYDARNNALLALESVVLSGHNTDQDLASQGLNACLVCDYKTPRIAQIVKIKIN